jgi:CheY-like chemotaxis protein
MAAVQESSRRAGAPLPLRPATAPVLAGNRILVVDDDPDAPDLVGEILRRAGSAVVTAASAAEALAAVARHRPTMIITDLGMPGDDGIDLLRRIRGLDDPQFRRIPALALTAYATATDRELTIAGGFQRHLVKPVDPVDLVNAVAEVMAAAGGSRSEPA